MKTVEDEVNELSKNLKMDQIVKSLLIRIIKIRDMDIRKDQDKITRHACAESITKIGKLRVDLESDWAIYKDKAHQAIILTQN